jgi:two-component system sensor histidine kinase TctE
VSDAARHPRLRRRLVVALLLPTLLLIALGALTDYFVARNLTDDAYDQAIAGVAEGLAVTLERDRDNDVPMHFQAMMRTLERIDAPDTWRYLVIDAAGRVVDGDLALRAIAAPDDGSATPRFRNASLHDVDQRVATLHYGPRGAGATIIVAETVLRRRSATGLIVGSMTAPNIVLIALAALFVLGGVRVALRPLDRLGARIDAQRARELTPLPLDDTPHETLPLLRALNGLIERLRGASRLQQQFVDLAAHQLRTPLAALQARIELLRDAAPTELAARSAALHADVARLSRLTTQLLTLSRTDGSAASALAMHRVDVAALVAELAPGFDDRARARGVQLAFELEPLEVDGVDWMLREALSNLVDNAVTHAPPGSTVTLRCSSRRLWRGAAIEVEDRGRGIPRELRERAFQPFVRLAEDSPGSGLGLAIVRGIAERHGATAELDAGRGEVGTVARIRFA